MDLVDNHLEVVENIQKEVVVDNFRAVVVVRTREQLEILLDSYMNLKKKP